MKRLSILLVLAALAACGKDKSQLTRNQYVQQRADIECAALSSACLMPVATCTAGRIAQYTTESQAAATRDFVPANAEACLGKVEEVYGKLNQGMVALAGSEYVTLQQICANVYRGASLANQTCASALDCADGLICDKGFCGTAKLVAAGAGCANIGEYCPPGSYCSGATGVWFCSPKVPVQGYCDALNPCSESSRCAAGVCVARLGIGEACASDGDCSSAFCEPYALKCANDIRFAPGTPACMAMGG